MGIVSSAVSKFRTTLLIMLFCIIAGVLGRTSMPIASNPNVTFPWVNIAVFLEGASPEDMARLVAKPLENRFLRLEGQEQVRSVNTQSFTNLTIQYDVDFDMTTIVLKHALNQYIKLPSKVFEMGIGTGSLLSIFLAKKFNYKEGDFPIAESTCKSVISLPVHEFISLSLIHI